MGRFNSPSFIVVLTVFFASGFLAGFNENLLNMALVSIMGEFNVDAVSAQWLVTGYMVAVTVVVSCMAFLYRRFSVRALFLTASVLSLGGSAAGFFAQSFILILVARLVQAVGTGVYIPLMMNVIVDKVPLEKLGKYMAIGSSMITIGPATAPIITGFLVSHCGWRSVFLVPLVAATLLLVAALFLVHDDRAPASARPKERFDVVSLLLITAGVTLLSMGLSEVAGRPWVGVGLLAGAAIALALFVWRQKCIAYPLVSLKALSNPTFWPAMVLVMVTMMTYFSLSVMVPLYFEESLGMAASLAGLLLVVPVLAHAGTAIFAGRAIDIFGEWPLLPLGLGIAVAGLGAMIAGVFTSAVSVVVIGVVAGYLGTGMVLSPGQTAGLRRLPMELNSHGVSLMAIAVQLAACLGPSTYIGVMSAVEGVCVGAGEGAAQAAAFGFAASMALAGLVALGGCVLAVWYSRRYGRRQAS